jgi:hypothetical protein
MLCLSKPHRHVAPLGTDVLLPYHSHVGQGGVKALAVSKHFLFLLGKPAFRTGQE